ncbi:UvrD-helicase domain-containing protein [Ktedonobacter racemifer]|uniref:DNA 3'-5' helicase n=1 Tax=Ktedonobacter racemifer DSM 44963 TaxID=485913 RepID=D6TX59_KTERA|nr:UvrD-helicase domain-containing protein [Ktedonobacter racemifer]EFH84792.1 UvrD/REP helicase [Ktedonobacter racemifer DSM 44963]
MSSEWLTTMKPTFQTEWLALPPKIAHQILEKIHYLTQDPLPDGDLKKQLTHNNRDVYRLESGDYRIMYTLQHPYISLLHLEKRQEKTYKKEYKSEYLGGYSPEETFSERVDKYTHEGATIPPSQALPSPITKKLLVNLLIPAQYHADLLSIEDEDSLLDASHVPDDYKLKVHTALFEKPLSQVFEEADYLLPEINSLMRYKEGDLLAFLLKLSPEQEKFVTWGLTSAGPTLLKGGPGTGKSAIALHRVYALIREFRERGHDDFRILFTTYTNALVHSSEQLLEQLLGKDIKFVEVSTTDLIARDILKEAGIQTEIIDQQELDDLLLQAMQDASYTGSVVQQKAQRQFIKDVNFDYLLQEINRVIVANQLESLEQYLAAPRPGRQMSLSALQRRAVWSVHEKLEQLLARERKITWHQLRTQAEKLVAQRQITRQYEAVIVDEAQDLDPSALRLMTQLCKTPRGLFITADANQSIYGSHFTWSSIHKDLQFRGRTGILHANYRSTREIGEAAQSYLQQGILDSDPVEREYIYNGPLPIVRNVNNDQEEAQLLASFLTAARRTYRLGIGSCAILCPNEKVGRSLAAALERYQIEAAFMSGQYLDLKRPCVKILTLNSAKGLEFPIVALAGFHKVNKYMRKPSQSTPEEQNEALALERRLLFVGMTRAMRALLLAVPTTSKSPLFEGFDTRYWNVEQQT